MRQAWRFAVIGRWRGAGVMTRWKSLAAALVLFAGPALASGALDGHECFSNDNERRITGCSDLIQQPGTPSETVGAAYAMRALAYSLKGLYDTAIRDYDQAIRIIPDFAVALNNRAWAYYKSDRASTGLPDVERSLKLQPTSQHAYDTRAHIRQWLGDSDGALRDYEAAMRFGGERMIKLYQCGLAMNKLYSGAVDGIYTPELRKAMQVCASTASCDPLPPDEECRAVTS